MIKKTLLGASLSLFLLGAFVSTEAKVDDSANAEEKIDIPHKHKKRGIFDGIIGMVTIFLTNLYNILNALVIIYGRPSGFCASSLIILYHLLRQSLSYPSNPLKQGGK